MAYELRVVIYSEVPARIPRRHSSTSFFSVNVDRFVMLPGHIGLAWYVPANAGWLEGMADGDGRRSHTYTVPGSRPNPKPKGKVVLLLDFPMTRLIFLTEELVNGVFISVNDTVYIV